MVKRVIASVDWFQYPLRVNSLSSGHECTSAMYSIQFQYPLRVNSLSSLDAAYRAEAQLSFQYPLRVNSLSSTAWLHTITT